VELQPLPKVPVFNLSRDVFIVFRVKEYLKYCKDPAISSKVLGVISNQKPTNQLTHQPTNQPTNPTQPNQTKLTNQQTNQL
jgi:hypothetical protein